MGAKSARKGAAGEREVMAILRDHGYPVERGGTQSFGQRPDLYGLDGVHLGIVQKIVQSGLDRDLSLEACLVGARLALSMESGKEELFSLDDIAAVLGCSREEAAAELEKQGIQGAQISTLPGFEWLLGQM